MFILVDFEIIKQTLEETENNGIPKLFEMSIGELCDIFVPA